MAQTAGQEKLSVDVRARACETHCEVMSGRLTVALAECL